MLLLLLSFYVHYDLFNCEEIVKANPTFNPTFNETLLVDHDHQKLLKVNTLLEDLEHKTRILSVLIADDHQDGTKRETFVLRSVIPEKNQTNQYLENSTNPAQILATPLYPFASYITNASTLVVSPDTNVTSEPSFPPLLFKPTPLRLSGQKIFPSSTLEPAHTSSFLSLLTTNTITPNPRPTIQVTFTPQRTTPFTPPSTIHTTPLGHKAKHWFDEVAAYTRVRKKLRKASRDQSQPTVLMPSVVKLTNYNMKAQVKENKHGSLRLTLAKNASIPGETPGDPYKNWTTTMTTAGDILYGRIKVKQPSTIPAPEQRYQELMKELGEGQLVMFGIEMFRLIAVKDKSEVRDVLAPAEKIFNTLLQSGRLVDVDNPFLTIFRNLATMTSENEIDTLRTYSSMMFHTLLKRKQVLSQEVNSMIDQAGLSYRDEEGNRLLCSLTQFEDYPNTNKSSYSICESLIKSILQPFRGPARSKNRKELLSSIYTALRHNFPQLMSDRGVPTFTTFSFIGTTTSGIATQRRRKRKNHRHHKKKRKRKRHQPEYDNKNPRYDNQELDNKEPSLIEAITTRRYRMMRPTRSSGPFWTTNDYEAMKYESKHTTRIAKRKLVRHRNGMILRHKKQARHARVRVTTQPTRTPWYQETPDLEDIEDSIDHAISGLAKYGYF